MTSNRNHRLSQEAIRDHFRRPRNRGRLPNATSKGEGHNPFCGDVVQVWLRVVDGRIEDVSFDGRGCAISQAAASMLTSTIKGKSISHATTLRQVFVEAIQSHQSKPPSQLGPLRALTGVGKFPNRVRCAVLAFDALDEALGIA